jgi:hypothetical protein
MLSYVGVLLAGTMLVGQPTELDALRETARGKWERPIAYDGKPHRLVKDIGAEKETLSLYTQSGELIYKHVVDYEIKLQNGLAVFEHWNRKVLVGGGEQDSQESTPEPSQRTKYVFRIHDNQWHEVHGLWIDSAQAPRVNIYARAAGDAPVASANPEERVPPGKEQLQQLAFVIGAWQNVADPKDRRVFEWINNNSYIMFLWGDYREIIGWDLVHERIVSWGYGTDGGQGKGLWTKEGDTWRFMSRGFLNRWGGSMSSYGVTIEQIDNDTLRFTSLAKDANGKPDYAATYQRIALENQ